MSVDTTTLSALQVKGEITDILNGKISVAFKN